MYLYVHIFMRKPIVHFECILRCDFAKVVDSGPQKTERNRVDAHADDDGVDGVYITYI